MSQGENRKGPPQGLMAKFAEIQEAINTEMSALTPQQRAERAKEDLRRMPGQSYLFRDDHA